MLFLPSVLCPLQVDKVTGRFNGQFKTYAICGAIRRMVSLWSLSDTGETPRLACQLVRWLLSSRGRFNLDRIKRRFCFFSAVGTNFQCVCWLEHPEALLCHEILLNALFLPAGRVWRLHPEAGKEWQRCRKVRTCSQSSARAHIEAFLSAPVNEDVFSVVFVLLIWENTWNCG